jgi:hypothetical protein
VLVPWPPRVPGSGGSEQTAETQSVSSGTDEHRSAEGNVQ